MSTNGEALEDTANIVADVLIDYMSRHETDIAMDINDYGDLAPVFIALIGHKPRGNPHVTPIAHAINKH